MLSVNHVSTVLHWAKKVKNCFKNTVVYLERDGACGKVIWKGSCCFINTCLARLHTLHDEIVCTLQEHNYVGDAAYVQV